MMKRKSYRNQTVRKPQRYPYRATKKRPGKKYHSEPLRFFRSRLERDVSDNMTGRGVGFGYETCRIKYVSTHAYIPDFILSNGIMIEVKGWFRSSDRAKHLRIKEQHPELDIRFLFSRAGQKLSRQSQTTYAQWCNRYGFQWCEKKVPQGWINEQTGNTIEQQNKQQLKLFES